MVVRIVIISIIAFLAKINQVHAQYLNLGFDASIGTTTKNSPFGYALGFDLVLKYKLSDQLSSSVALGYARLLTKDTSPIPDYDFIPLKGSIKIFPTPMPIYFAATAGVGFGIQKGVKTSFLFGGGTGYQWETGYDIGLKYEGYQQSKKSTAYQPLNGQFALTFAYCF